jgi:acetyl esterase/lipase
MLGQGLKPARIAVAGDSAAAADRGDARAIRDAKLPLPAEARASRRGSTSKECGESMTTKADVDPIVQKAGSLADGVAAYIWAARPPATPQAAAALPKYTRDLSPGCRPPFSIQVGRRPKTLHHDASSPAERARKAGETGETNEPWESMIHVWQPSLLRCSTKTAGHPNPHRRVSSGEQAA